MTSPKATYAAVSELAVGDSFKWMHFTVKITDIERQPTKRPGRRLFIEHHDGGRDRLHYYDDEVVERAE